MGWFLYDNGLRHERVNVGILPKRTVSAEFLAIFQKFSETVRFYKIFTKGNRWNCDIFGSAIWSNLEKVQIGSDSG